MNFMAAAAASPGACLRALTYLLALCCAPQLHAQDAVYSADSVKAAYLFHFSGYVEWQETPPEILTIGVIGDRGVAAELNRILPGRTIGERTLRVREIGADDDLSGIQILFVGRSESARMPALAEKARKRHILLVSDADAGLDRGSAINFVTADRRVRFEISLRAAEDAGIKISSRLLSAALKLKRSFWLPRSAIARLARGLGTEG